MIKTLKCFNLCNASGDKVYLYLGIDESIALARGKDTGYRWRFVGTKIPMPVRNGTWFNGFPESVMLDWLKGNGWYAESCVNMNTGRYKVFNLPKGNEKSTGTTEFPIHMEQEKPIFERVICELMDAGRSATATRLYRYAHGGGVRSAYEAVKAIYEKT